MPSGLDWMWKEANPLTGWNMGEIGEAQSLDLTLSRDWKYNRWELGGQEIMQGWLNSGASAFWVGAAVDNNKAQVVVMRE